MKFIITVCLIVLLAPFAWLAQPSIAFAQDNPAQVTTKLPPAAPLLSPAICGKGVFQLLVGEQSVGREEFEIKCQPDGGYAATGHTVLSGGPVSDLNTTLDVDKSGEPSSSTAKGTVRGQPFDQSLVIKGATATITTNGNAKDLPFAKGMSFLGNNIFYMFQFLLARYDGARGGAQQVPLFPTQAIKLERVARDAVQASGATAATTMLDRYSAVVGMAELTIWADDKGRIAVIAVPMQNFAAVREEYAGLVPSLKAIISAKLKVAEIDYNAPPGAPFTAEEVTVKAKGFTLAGTLLLPKTGKRPFPAVITITGSGQQTRDEALPLPGLENYKPFRQIAEMLAARGIAVLRVDDRGVGKSQGRDTLATATTADFADDVRAQVDYLRSRVEIDPSRIALVGHSEGGVIAPMVAASDPRIAAIVLMAGTAKRGDAVLEYQLNEGVEHDATLTEEQKARKRVENREMLRKISEGGDTSGVDERLRGAWMKYFLVYDPLPTIRKVRQPILILQGEIDRQVTAEQAITLEQAALAAGNHGVTRSIYRGLNHLFLPATTGAPTEYSSLSTNIIGDNVLDTLGNWLQENLKATK